MKDLSGLVWDPEVEMWPGMTSHERMVGLRSDVEVAGRPLTCVWP